MWSRAARLPMLFDLGRWDELLEVCAGLEERDREAGGTQITGLVLAARAPVLAHRGRAAEALERQDEMLGGAREAVDLQFLLPALAAAATTSAAAGDAAAVGGFVREFREAARGGVTVHRELFGPPVVRAALAIGNAEAAAGLVAEFAGASPRQAAAAVTGRALVAAAEGRPAEALAGFDEAEARWEAHGVVTERALAAMGAAGCLAATGRPGEARERAEAAAAVLLELGAAHPAGPWS
jgi:tetratricopeptide (TPR) repeat protein